MRITQNRRKVAGGARFLKLFLCQSPAEWLSTLSSWGSDGDNNRTWSVFGRYDDCSPTLFLLAVVLSCLSYLMSCWKLQTSRRGAERYCSFDTKPHSHFCASVKRQDQDAWSTLPGDDLYNNYLTLTIASGTAFRAMYDFWWSRTSTTTVSLKNSCYCCWKIEHHQSRCESRCTNVSFHPRIRWASTTLVKSESSTTDAVSIGAWWTRQWPCQQFSLLDVMFFATFYIPM